MSDVLQIPIRFAPPKMVAELEATGRLHSQLLKAEEQTDEDLDSKRRHLIQQGLNRRYRSRKARIGRAAIPHQVPRKARTSACTCS